MSGCIPLGGCGDFPPQPIVYTSDMTLLDRVLLIEKELKKVVEDSEKTDKEIEVIKAEIAEIEKILAEFDTEKAKEIVEKYLATMIFVEISKSGYIIYYIPERWEDITFNTQGVDVNLPGVEYGRLILSY